LNSQLKIPSSLQKLESDLFKKHQVDVYVKRDDLIHPEISGNKWRKLKLNFEKFHQGKYESILTFGGAFSNHIAATASLGNSAGIKTIGIIRGEELTAESNDTLKQASANGMKLIFVSRDKYSERYERIYHEELRREYGNILLIEEGGANFLGAMGIADCVKELNFEPDYIYTAAGTGTTSAGLLIATNKSKIVSVPVLKNGEFLIDEIRNLVHLASFDEELTIEKMERLQLETDFHFGGYGKYNQELIDFINEIHKTHQLKLDQIYTAKMFYTFIENLKSGKIRSNSTVVLLHTGGIQGLSTIKSQLNF